MPVGNGRMKSEHGSVTELSWRPSDYASRLTSILQTHDWSSVDRLIKDLTAVWVFRRTLFICGNGGSAANALHWANDFMYPVAKEHGIGLQVTPLVANTAVLSCLANDVGYESVFSHQLRVLAKRDDYLLVLSGSGNSPNVLSAIRAAKELGLGTAAILGFSGGEALKMVDVAVHFAVDDMQIAEDLQIVVNHMVMRALAASAPVRE